METIRYEHWFHLAALISLPGSTVHECVRNSKLRDVAKAFVANITRAVQAARAPIELVLLSRAHQRATDEAYFEVCGNLAYIKPDDHRVTRLEEVIARLRSEFQAARKDNSDHLEQAMAYLDLYQDYSEEIYFGLGSVLGGLIVGVWTAFEVLAADLWENAINEHPAELATLKGDVVSSKTKETLRALASQDGGKSSQPKMLRLDFLQLHKYDLSRLMGTVLSEKFNFQRLEDIRTAYTQAFGEAHCAVRDAILHPCLTSLSATRNALVHGAGNADEKFMGLHTSCEALRLLFPEAALNKPLPVTGHTVLALVDPVVEQSVNLIVAVSEFVGPDKGNIK